jgi:hypothetical protein
MGKRNDSVLIEQVLANVERGLIVGREGSSGPDTLDNLCSALRAIQAGADVDDAFGIDRKTGPDTDPFRFTIAALVHHYRERGEKWATIEELLVPFLESNGRERIPESTLKNLYKEKCADVERALSIRKMSESAQSVTKSE